MTKIVRKHPQGISRKSFMYFLNKDELFIEYIFVNEHLYTIVCTNNYICLKESTKCRRNSAMFCNL